MAYVNVQIQQLPRERRIYFAEPFTGELEPGKTTHYKWHDNINRKGTPVVDIPLAEPGKYKCTFIECNRKLEGEVFRLFTGPNLFMDGPLKYYPDNKDGRQHSPEEAQVDETYFMAYFLHPDNCGISVLLENKADVLLHLDGFAKNTCLVIELIL